MVDVFLRLLLTLKKNYRKKTVLKKINDFLKDVVVLFSFQFYLRLQLCLYPTLLYLIVDVKKVDVIFIWGNSKSLLNAECKRVM